jgi:hypothetical protein
VFIGTPKSSLSLCTGNNNLDVDFFSVDVPADGIVKFEFDLFGKPDYSSTPRVRLYQGTIGAGSTADYLIEEMVLDDDLPKKQAYRWVVDAPAIANSKLFVRLDVVRYTEDSYFPLDSYAVTAYHLVGCPSMLGKSTSHGFSADLAGDLDYSYIGQLRYLSGEFTLPYTGSDEDDELSQGFFCGDVNEHYWAVSPPETFLALTDLQLTPSGADSGNHLWYTLLDENTYEELIEPTPLDYSVTFVTETELMYLPPTSILKVFRSGSASDPTADPPTTPYRFTMSMGISTCAGGLDEDEFEPDTSLTANEIVEMPLGGPAVERFLCPARDVDYILVNPSESGVLELRVTQYKNVNQDVDASHWRMHQLNEAGEVAVTHPIEMVTDNVYRTSPSSSVVTFLSFPVAAGTEYALETYSTSGVYEYTVEGNVWPCFTTIPATLTGVGALGTAPDLSLSSDAEVYGAFCDGGNAAESAGTHYYRIDLPATSGDSTFVIRDILTVPTTATPEDTAYYRGSATGDCGSMTGCPVMTIDVVDATETVYAGPVFNNGTMNPIVVEVDEATVSELYIRVHVDDSTSLLPSYYTFEVSALDSCSSADDEWNDDFTSALDLTIPEITYGAICPTGDEDVYKFSLEVGSYIEMAGEFDDSSPLRVGIFSEATNYSDVWYTMTESDSVALALPAGEHFVRVTTSEGGPSTGSYWIQTFNYQDECSPLTGPEDNIALSGGPQVVAHCVDTEGVYHDESFYLVTPEYTMGTMIVEVEPVFGFGQFDVDFVRFSADDDKSMPHPSPSLVVASFGRTATVRSAGALPSASQVSAYVLDIDLDLDEYSYYVRVKSAGNISQTGPMIAVVSAVDSFYPDPSVCDSNVGEDDYQGDYYYEDNLPWVPMNGEIVGTYCDYESDAYRYQPRGPGVLSVTVEMYAEDLDEGLSVYLYAVMANGPSVMYPGGEDYLRDYVSSTNEKMRARTRLYAVDKAEIIVEIFGAYDTPIPWYRVTIEEDVGGCYPNAEAFASLDTAPVAWRKVGYGDDDDDYDYYYGYYGGPGKPRRKRLSGGQRSDSLRTEFELHQPAPASFCGSVGNGTIYMGLLHEDGPSTYEVEPFVTNPETPPYEYEQRSWFTASMVYRDGSPVLPDSEGGHSAGVRSVPRSADPRGSIAYEMGDTVISATAHSGEPVSLAVTRTSPISSWLWYMLEYEEGDDSPFSAPRIPHEQRAPQNHSLSGSVTPCTKDALEPNDGTTVSSFGITSHQATIIDEDQLFPSGGAASSVSLHSLTLCPKEDVDTFIVDIPSSNDREFPGRVVLITLTGRENPPRPCSTDDDCSTKEACSISQYCTYTGERRDYYEGEKVFSLNPPVFVETEYDAFYYQTGVTLLAGESVTFPVWVSKSFGFRLSGAPSTRSLPYDVDVQSLEEGACSMADVRASLPRGSILMASQLLITRDVNENFPYADAERSSSLSSPMDFHYHYYEKDVSAGAVEMGNGLLCPEVSNEHFYVSDSEGSSRIIRYTVRPHLDAHASLLSVELYTVDGGAPDLVNLSTATIPADAPAHLADNGLIGILVTGTDNVVLRVSQDEASATPIGYTVSIDNADSLENEDCVPDRLAPNHRIMHGTIHGPTISRSNPSVTVDELTLCGRYSGPEKDIHFFMVDEYVTDLSFTVSVPEGETTPLGRVFTNPTTGNNLGYLASKATSSTWVMPYAFPGMYKFSLDGGAAEYSVEVRVDGGFHGRYVAETDAQTNVSAVPATCGNGVVDEGEACDPSAETLLPGTTSCCSPSCDGPRPTGVTCYAPPRGLACAAPQVCDGVSTSCPAPSEVLPAGTLCAAGSECREATVCDGSSVICPEPAARVGESCSPAPHSNDCDSNANLGTCNFLGVCEFSQGACRCSSHSPPSTCDTDRNPCTLEGCDVDEGECVSLGNADEGTTCIIAKLSGVVEGTCDGAGVCVEGEPVACPDDCTSPWHGTCVAGTCVCNPQMKGESCSEYAGPSTVTTDDGRDFDTLSPPCEIRFDTDTFTSVAAGRAARVASSCGAIAMLHLDAATAAEEGATIRFGATTGVGVDVPGAPLHHAGAFNAGEGVVMLFAPTSAVGDDGVAALDATDAVEVMVTSVLLSAPGETVEAEAFFGVLNVHDDEDILVPVAPARIQAPRAKFTGATSLPVATHALLWNNGSSTSTAYFSLKSVTVQLVKLADGRSLAEDPLALAEPVEDDGEGEGEGEGNVPSTDTDDDDNGGDGGAMAADASADAEGLSGGAVAGIVIGVLIAVALIVAATFMVATRMATGKAGGSAPASSAASGTEMNTMSEPAASTADLTETKAEADAEADADAEGDKEKEEEKKEEV